MMKTLVLYVLMYTLSGGRPSNAQAYLDEDIDDVERRSSSQLSQVNAVAKSLSEGILSFAKTKKGSSLPPRIDLTLILDSSSAVGGQRNFLSLRKFALRLVSEFSISPSTTRVSVILCSSNPLLAFGLDKFVNRECTLKAMKNIRYLQGSYCSLRRALDMTRKGVFRKNYQHAKRLVFIVASVDKDRDGYHLALAAEQLHHKGADIFALSIGENDKKDRKMTSKPFKLYNLRVKDYKALGDVSELIKDKGLDRSCKKGIVYDECDRRCRCSKGRMVDCSRVRKDFQSMTLKERRLYIDALKTVSTVQPYKRIYDELTSYHPRWFKEVHQLKYFFPWHRWYILKFENFLRQIDCRVTVPYWDWTRAVSKGALWRASHIRDVWHPGPHGLGGNGIGTKNCVRTGPFSKDNWSVCFILKGKDQFCLSREFNTCFSKRLPDIKKAKNLFQFPYEKFVKFEKIVREYMHDDFHNSIGGVMSFEESANAPEFWFHHGFLDKLWGDWQRRGYKYKHQYFHGVYSDMPGANISGSVYIDLENQPMCVKVIQDQPVDMEEYKEEFDRSIEDPKPIYKCHHNNA